MQQKAPLIYFIVESHVANVCTEHFTKGTFSIGTIQFFKRFIPCVFLVTVYNFSFRFVCFCDRRLFGYFPLGFTNSIKVVYQYFAT